MNLDFLIPIKLRGINPYLLVLLYGTAGFYLGSAAGAASKKKDEKKRLAQLGGAAGVIVAMSYARKQIACRISEEPGRCP